MFTLTIESDGSGTCRSPAYDSRPQIWRADDGSICAYGGTQGRTCWMDFPGLARFCFSAQSNSVVAFAQEPVKAAAIQDTFCRFVLPMAIQTEGKEVLHASAVES